MTIGEKIFYIRTDRGISQEALAEKLGVSRQSVSKWELGDSVPGLDKITAVCNFFNISYNDFLSEDAEIVPKKCGLPTLMPDGEGNNKYFGTDGFRGEVNVSLTSEQAYKVGRFIGWYYSSRASMGKRAKIVIGKDTRRSSYTLEYSIIAGITASGADVYMLHVITTPGVSYITRCDGFDCGIMITASHNPYHDNGIKLLNERGEKMEDSVISLLEYYLDGRLGELGLDSDIPYATGEKLGKITDFTAGRHRYIGYLISLVSHSFKSLRIGIDCSNGAAWSIAPAVFNALGAELHLVGCEPNGLNINRGVGSTHIDALISAVKKNRLDVGFAFDGDADRCLAVDSSGNIIDGDKIMYVLAKRLKERGALEGGRIAVTVMSNAGLIEALGKEGIGADTTPVGDRYVYECMNEKGYSLGGEQSGHIILKKYATTGDGLLTALILTEQMLEKKASLRTLSAPVSIYPSILKNVTVTDRDAVMADSDVCAAVDKIRAALSGKGKVLLRKSGTEPLIRVLVECQSEDECRGYVDEIISVMKKKGFICD